MEEQEIKKPKKPFHKKRNKNYTPFNGQKGYRLAYSTSTESTKVEDWKLKLQAIGDCYKFRKNDDYAVKVESRYQELLHKNK